LAASMVAAFATREASGRWGPITGHEWTGYMALFAAALRMWLGFFGSGRWRFRDFVVGPAATVRYAQDVLQRREARFLGHNPLGAWMIIALLADAMLCGLTGWLSTTDRFWGVAWVGNLHDWFGHALLPLLALHVAGVAFTSWRHRENLLAAMVHGKKSMPTSAPQ
jgi:cytochrome b